MKILSNNIVFSLGKVFSIACILLLFSISAWTQTPCPCQDYVYTNQSSNCTNTPQSMIRNCDWSRWYKSDFGKLRVPIHFFKGGMIRKTTTQLNQILSEVNDIYLFNNIPVEFY